MKEQLDRIIDELLDAGIALSAAGQLFVETYVSAALRRHRDNITATARALGVHRNTLHNIITRRPAVKGSMQRKQRRSQATKARLREAHLAEKRRTR